MLQSNSKKFNINLRLEDGLSTCTKQELTDFSKLLMLKGAYKLRKAELAKAISSFLLENPSVWVNMLPAYELDLLDRLVENGAGKFLEEDIALMPNLLERFSLIVIDPDHDVPEKVCFMIFEDLRQAVAPVIKEVLGNPENKTRFFIEQYFYGIVNLYGMIPFFDAVEMIRGYLFEMMDEIRIGSLLMDSLGVRFAIFELMTDDGPMLFVNSGYVADPEYLDMMILQRKEITSYKSFTKEEILAAGEMPMMHIPNRMNPELTRFLRNTMKFSDFRVKSSMVYLWFNMQMEVNPMTAITDVIDGGLDTMAQLQQAVELLSEYCNQIPRWFLKGYSPSESEAIFALRERVMPKLVAGPNMKAAGLEITADVQQEFEEIYQQMFATEKVGRNDLCPCGSGKKYKKCCGSN